MKSAAFRSFVKRRVPVRIALSGAVFVLTFCAALYYCHITCNSVAADRRDTYERQQRTYQMIVTARLQQYEQFVRGGSGLLTVSPDLTQQEWVNYFQLYNIAQTHPEVQGIGFSRYTPQSGDNQPSTRVIFNVGFNDATNNGKSFGYNGFGNSVRRAAMLAAVQSNQPCVSGLVSLVSDPRPNHPAFIMYFPVYKPGMPLDTIEQRTQALYGFSYAAIDMTRMLDDLHHENPNLHVSAHIEDAEAPVKSLYYQNADYQSILATRGNLHSTQTVYLYGHNWLTSYAAGPDIIAMPERQLPSQTLWRGLFSSFLLTGVVWYIVTDRERKYIRQKQLEVQVAKDDLLSLASHQLRTPATVVKQYVGMLLRGYAGKVTCQQKEMLTHAYDSNERQLNIINQLLHVARLDAGRLRLRCERTDVNKLICGVIDDYASTVIDRDHTLTYEQLGRSVMARIDPQYIRMVIENLLSNALKYTPNGGTVAIKLQKTHAEVLIMVSDSGVGIDLRQQAIIFDKFTRVENDLSGDVNGSGVGLYVTREIMRLHHGTVEVYSAPGKGSTFVVRIPVHTKTVDVTVMNV